MGRVFCLGCGNAAVVVDGRMGSLRIPPGLAAIFIVCRILADIRAGISTFQLEASLLRPGRPLFIHTRFQRHPLPRHRGNRREVDGPEIPERIKA
jgi:hypothetical protein